MNKFNSTGSVSNLKTGGRPRTVRTEETRELVADAVASNANSSVRSLSRQLEISKSSLHRVMRQDLKLFPYKIQITHALFPNDFERRVEFARSFMSLCETDSFIHNLMMSDESHFRLNGCVNKQNCRIWATENPKLTRAIPAHSPKTTVWCGMTSTKILGPYFF